MQSVETVQGAFAVVYQIQTEQYDNEHGLPCDMSCVSPLSLTLLSGEPRTWNGNATRLAHAYDATSEPCNCCSLGVFVCVYVCELKKASNLKTLVNNWTCSWRHGMMPHTVFPQALMISLQDTCRMAQTQRGCKASSTARSPPNRKMQWAVGSVCLCISVLQQPVCSILFLLDVIVAILLIDSVREETGNKKENRKWMGS